MLAVFGGSSNKAIELILLILGSWLVIVVDVFLLLGTCFRWNLDDSCRWSRSGANELSMLIWKCIFVGPLAHITRVWGLRKGFWSSSYAKMSRDRPKMSSQATKHLVLGDCKSASPGRNKVNFSIEPLVSTKGKMFVNTLISLQLERFEDILCC
jgi:hypothetical protein